MKNLNVLDHEHYASPTALQGDTAGCLIEFNDILQQGFDGHLFVAGLGHHFRDLLVCQDPRTAGLLEVSEDLTALRGPGRSHPRESLVKGLELVAQCDGQYKGTKEPRLLVELLLLRLCALAGRTEGASLSEEKSPDVPIAAPRPAQSVPARPAAPEPVAPRACCGRTCHRGRRPSLPPGGPGTGAAETPSGRAGLHQALTEQAEEQARPEQPVRATEIDAGTGAPGATSDPEKAIPHPAAEDRRTTRWSTSMLSRNSLRHPHRQTAGDRRSPAGHLTIVNEVQGEYMREEKPQLLGRLRRELEMPDLELEVVKEEVTDLRPRLHLGRTASTSWPRRTPPC